MKIVQIITDYIRRSILTTQGDLVVRGAALPERLVGVALGQSLKSGGIGALPAWGVPKLKECLFANGTFNRDLPGDEVITGVGFEPSIVFFLVVDGISSNINWSIGIDYGSVHQCVCQHTNATVITIIGGSSIAIRRDASNVIYGEISAFGSDGFTVTFTETGASSAYVLWTAIG